uniref:Uncharacterized protein n=1 Tax=Glossina pallidipes TaxID=7398 RepID=A0A1A9ZND6_GLOPL
MNSLSDNEEINKDVQETIKQKWTLTEEDLERQFTDAELKKLCLRHKCRVDMFKWNPVNEMREKLVKDGRFKQRSFAYCLRLTAKGFNKYKHKISYDPKIIQKWREEDWRDRLKNSILSLGMWLSDEKEEQQDEEPFQHVEARHGIGEFVRFDNELPGSTERTFEGSLEDIRPEIREALDVNTDSMSLNTQDVLYSEPISAPTNYDEFDDRIQLTSTQEQELNLANAIIF